MSEEKPKQEYLSDRNYNVENNYFREFHKKLGRGFWVTDYDQIAYNIKTPGDVFLKPSLLKEEYIQKCAYLSYSPFDSSKEASDFNYIMKEKKKLPLLCQRQDAEFHKVPTYHIFFDEKSHRWIVFLIKKEAMPEYYSEFNDTGFIKFDKLIHTPDFIKAMYLKSIE